MPAPAFVSPEFPVSRPTPARPSPAATFFVPKLEFENQNEIQLRGNFSLKLLSEARNIILSNKIDLTRQ